MAPTTVPQSLGHFLKLNHRWLAAGALLTLLSSFGQTFFISIFAAQIQSTFSLSHGSWGALYGLGTAFSAIVMIWSGGLTDRFRARSLGVIVLTMLAASCLLMALNPYAALLPFVIFMLRLTGQGMTSHIAIVAMARWFVGNARPSTFHRDAGLLFGRGGFAPAVCCVDGISGLARIVGLGRGYCADGRADPVVSVKRRTNAAIHGG